MPSNSVKALNASLFNGYVPFLELTKLPLYTLDLRSSSVTLLVTWRAGENASTDPSRLLGDNFRTAANDMHGNFNALIEGFYFCVRHYDIINPYSEAVIHSGNSVFFIICSTGHGNPFLPARCSASAVFATATWLAGWNVGCHATVLCLND